MEAYLDAPFPLLWEVELCSDKSCDIYGHQEFYLKAKDPVPLDGYRGVPQICLNWIAKIVWKMVCPKNHSQARVDFFQLFCHPFPMAF